MELWQQRHNPSRIQPLSPPRLVWRPESLAPSPEVASLEFLLLWFRSLWLFPLDELWLRFDGLQLSRPRPPRCARPRPRPPPLRKERAPPCMTVFNTRLLLLLSGLWPLDDTLPWMWMALNVVALFAMSSNGKTLPVLPAGAWLHSSPVLNAVNCSLGRAFGNVEVFLRSAAVCLNIASSAQMRRLGCRVEIVTISNCQRCELLMQLLRAVHVRSRERAFKSEEGSATVSIVV